MAIASVLTSVKKVLGITEADTSFDEDIVLLTNGVFATLNQLGIGPSGGFAIEDKTATWVDFLGSDPRLNNVKQLTCLSVRLAFDPPHTGYLLTALQDQVKELTWRVNAYREVTGWTDPDPAEELV